MESTLDIEFQQGLPTEDDINEFTDGTFHSLIIIDDLMQSMMSDKYAQELITKVSHHKLVNIIYINQNLFSQGKNSRTIAVNMHYIIFLRNPRSHSQLISLGKQTGMTKTLLEAYADSMTQHPFGYLIYNLSPKCDNDNFVLMSNIMPEDEGIITYKSVN